MKFHVDQESCGKREEFQLTTTQSFNARQRTQNKSSLSQGRGGEGGGGKKVLRKRK
jgi:hypothetical protein